ncbi:hypothetical protein FRC03_005872 [Tulasnella sp. 419]|nr:hypothetical protein FRC02_004417 [Tulasnella sp. 418]KAG8939975.1 hypothetical protein FRC03_005872 [Tulasnella sp. 419]
MTQAQEVVEAESNAASDRLSMQYGIKGIPILSCLSSIEFPTSFPYDFMHLVWENVIKSLVLLWTGEYRDLDKEERQPYHLGKKVWEAIGAATVEAGDTIPAAFGRRVPNIAESRSEFTAEAWAIWTLFLGPILLEGRFIQASYYTHFVELVKLINICLQFEISKEDIAFLWMGLAKWVVQYERQVYSG